MANIQDCPGFEPFRANVKAARKKRRLSRKEAAEMIDISTVYLINIENNHIIPALPVQHQLTADALALVVSVLPCDELLEILCGRQIENVDKLYLCPEEHLPVIEGALDGVIRDK